MSSSVLLDKKINTALTKLTTRQKKALLTVAETFVKEEVQWGNADFIKEIDKRFAEYESGKIKSISLESLEVKARAAYTTKKTRAK